MSQKVLNVVAAHKQGQRVGVYSICSAHPFVLEAAIQQVLQDGSFLLVESTCNQVNQEGGYTGMRPAEFHNYLWGIAERFSFPCERLILGGDHLGPGPWQHEPAARAMTKAKVLIRDCVRAGYTKIHLDASMRCADDPPDAPLDKAVSAMRAAELCQVAEETWVEFRANEAAPCYVVGTEVPPPGGAQEHEDELSVTSIQDVQETIDLTRKAFRQRGLEAAWERVAAVVVQPGVEFGDDALFEYDRQAVAPLSQFIEGHDHFVFEAHSTDYQSRNALRALVEDHFAILKVGPALTFAFREAVFALAMMEVEWLAGRKGVEVSNARRALDNAMLKNPTYWQRYYAGPKPRAKFARKYSYSDRSRYYWPDPDVQRALARLLDNLERYPVPLTLLSQFMPVQYRRVRAGRLRNLPRNLIDDRIRSVIADYAYACSGKEPYDL